MNLTISGPGFSIPDLNQGSGGDFLRRFRICGQNPPTLWTGVLGSSGLTCVPGTCLSIEREARYS